MSIFVNLRSPFQFLFQSVIATTVMTDPGVFPFDDLPNELKLKVYEQYFSDTEIQLCHWDDEKKNFCFNGMKSLNLELTCKAICDDSRKVRGRLISKTLLISEEDFLDKTMREFASSSKFAWLRGHVHGLKLALGCPLGDSHEFEGNWQKLINCLPNIQNVEICLPCAVMFAPMSEEHFNSRSAFEGWLGGSVRAFVSSGVGHEDIDLAGEYMLHELAIAMRATEENGRVKVSYRRWAVNPLRHSRAYFFIVSANMMGLYVSNLNTNTF